MSDSTVAPAPLDAVFVRDFVKRWHDAWNSQDSARVAQLCTDDVKILDPSRPEPLHGPEGVRALLEPLARAFPDYRFNSTEEPLLSQSAPRVVVPWRFTATMRGPLDPPGFGPTGAVVTFEGDDHWEFRGDRVLVTRALYDLNAVAVQIGAAPAPGSRGERIGVRLQRLEAWRRRRARR